MSFLEKVSGSIVVAVFVFALVMFAYSAQVDNNVSLTILDDPHFEGINDTFAKNLSNVRGQAQDSRTSVEGDTPQVGSDETFGLLTIPRAVWRFTSLMFASFGLVTGLLENVFGVPAIVFNVLGGLLVIIMVVLGWRVIRGGGT